MHECACNDGTLHHLDCKGLEQGACVAYQHHMLITARTLPQRKDCWAGSMQTDPWGQGFCVLT